MAAQSENSDSESPVMLQGPEIMLNLKSNT